ncbi:rhodanese-like domain-containing protein [Streptomyces sp. TRM76323]|uniref:Rhodanese-like domain-containing protein n=1 Tax=Streptomyces tamarix TaxID=3078565 RepID=A0ABU3QUT4_9ACTN|nr:rhodanese-like domain-containing protein [Streptomyces tamarix]MDT9686308.1 rhodanese-like domain-containing protein [Streptomyces tamarix]
MTGIDRHLAEVRAGLDRLGPKEAWRAVRDDGALLVDTRPEATRRAEGGIPGALVIERNHLEWRCDPASEGALPQATSTGIRWIVFCDEGYASSLAAASLRTIGLSRATDLVGGFRAWRAAGLPVAPG